MISNGALQVTPDSAGNFSLAHRSGRVLFNRPFKLWEGDGNGRVASFNSSFLINIFRLNNDSAPGEGFAFIIAPDLNLPPGSDGEYLGLTNSTTDGNPNNHLIAVELDTFKQDFDSDDNHIGLDINSIRSNRTVSLSDLGIQIAPLDPKNYSVWVEYDGENKVMDVYMVEEGNPRPAEPVMSAEVELREIVKQYSYMGFAASTGNATQLNCVLQWNLTVELLEEDGDAEWVKVVLEERRAKSDPNILGTLRSLPGTPREFEFKDLKKATNNFDEKLKLGEGGFGVVYKGLLPKEHVHVAVKKFSRDVKGKDDFLAELTIINRLRHKHLVPLLGWCHKNGMLLLVYDYMPNGSLDKQLFCGREMRTLEWSVEATLDLREPWRMRRTHTRSWRECRYNGLHCTRVFPYWEATPESDVYGFGAVLLEVVCAQRPWASDATFHFLVDWVWCLHREGRIVEAVDERLGNDYVVEEAQRLLLLGLACSHPIATERPKTQAIVQVLSGSVSVPYVPPFKPALCGHPWLLFPRLPILTSRMIHPLVSTLVGPQSALAGRATSDHRTSFSQFLLLNFFLFSIPFL
ncbi:putative L-type lectin-domain containing receptor kinase S.5 [Vitis vinifera]|uniref:non-specific serine/threonine protein kinase n=1 Tax=Vitis vinifera TaxID=29760 RepID=A0A438D2A5_VITVI|nr:putative L-type lectin-domain containing receptor kinase S.5 [Vitis vinifera]